MAIGQAPRLDFLTPEDNVDLSPRGLIAVNPQTSDDLGCRESSPVATAFLDRG